MAPVREEVFELVFAGAAVVVFASAGAALFGRVSRNTLAALTGLVAVAAAAAWVVFALEPTRGARGRRRRAHRLRRDSSSARSRFSGSSCARRMSSGSWTEAETRLDALVARETEAHAAELERTLARARADSLSRLVAEERRIGEERRSCARRAGEQAPSAELSEALAQGRAAGQPSPDRAGRPTSSARSSRSRRSSTGARTAPAAADGGGEVATRARHRAPRHGQRGPARAAGAPLEPSSTQRCARSDSARRSDLEAHERDRRRALARGRRPAPPPRAGAHASASRPRRPRRSSGSRPASPTSSAASSTSSSASSSGPRTAFSEAVSQQFDVVIRAPREDAAQRLSRELDRAVAHFAKEAQGSPGRAARPRRRRRRPAPRAQALGDRQRRSSTSGTSSSRELQRRIGDAEVGLRSQVQALAADAEAERTVLNARLQDLQRRIDEALNEAGSRLSRRRFAAPDHGNSKLPRAGFV